MEKYWSKPKDHTKLPNLLEKGITSCVYIDLNEKYSDSKNYVPRIVGVRKVNPEVDDKQFHYDYLDILYHYRNGPDSKPKRVPSKNLRKNGKSGIVIPDEITDRLARKRFYLRSWKRLNYIPVKKSATEGTPTPSVASDITPTPSVVSDVTSTPTALGDPRVTDATDNIILLP
jgi:hypothetical protein